jgi:hypothetical protein
VFCLNLALGVVIRACMYVYILVIYEVFDVRFIIIIPQFRVTIATNCRKIPCWLKLGFVIGHE